MSVNNNDMQPISPAQNQPNDNTKYIWEEFKEEINNEIDKVKAKIAAIMAALKHGNGTTAVWPMVELLVDKISSISSELAEGPIAAQQDFDATSTALAALEQDIKNMEKKGELDPNGKKDGSKISAADAKKFAKDLNAYAKASAKWKADYKAAPKEFKDKYFNANKMMNKNNDILDSIGNEKCPNGAPLAAIVAAALLSGNYDQLVTVLASFAKNHGENVNNKKSKNNDAFDNWETGNNKDYPTDGIDIYLHTELPGAIAENNDLINRDGSLINNAYSAGSAVVKAGTDQQQYWVSHQIANG